MVSARSPASSSSSSSTTSSRYLKSSPSSTSYNSPKRKAGRKKFRETRHPVYHGVRARNGGKWVCEVREPHKKTRIWLGTYQTPEMAARAHDVAVLALRGESAPLNFPDSKWAMPQAGSTLPDEIRRAAAEAAEMCSPSLCPPQRVSRTVVKTCDLSLSSTTAMEVVATAVTTPVVFIDEDAMLNMPELLMDMAAGLLITPPAVWRRFEWDSVVEVDTNLWNYECSN